MIKKLLGLAIVLIFIAMIGTVQAIPSNATFNSWYDITIGKDNGGAEYQNESPETTLVDMTGTGRNFVLMITRDYATESPSLAASAGLLSVEIYCTRTLA
jgi:hypothetical protein